MRLKELLKGVKTIQTIGDEQVKVAHITQDSRKIVENTLFFAVKGAKIDGHSFIERRASLFVKSFLKLVLKG